MFLRWLIIIAWSMNSMIDGRHFNGGTITWAPVDPYTNSSPVDVTITQAYAWTYPVISCANDVPISTPGRSSQNANLACMADCGTDGGYSSAPIDILTDCQSFSTSLGMMNSQRSKNISLAADAHFYLSYEGSAWVTLNDPAQSGLQWSIVTYIDLRKRSDGFINTPPVATVVSPQYAFVNETIQINIPVSDVNTGDDIRCRWSTYTAGYRRRRQVTVEETNPAVDKETEIIDLVHSRFRRASCNSGCWKDFRCNRTECLGTTCYGWKCQYEPCCNLTGTTTSQTTQTTTTTTMETPGTLKATSSFANRQAIDECGGICFPGSLPIDTNLTSTCTLTFTGTKPNTWYGVSIQVEDFIDKNSTKPMSSVPVQFLIYVRGPPSCSIPPTILPLDMCLEFQVAVNKSFNVFALNNCDPRIAVVGDILPSPPLVGLTNGVLRNATTDGLISYVTYSWAPQISQIGNQQLCFVAYTSEQVKSTPYCTTVSVNNTADICATTTTTSTTTTSETTTTTSITTTTSQTTTTSVTTTTTSVTTTSTTSVTTTTTTTTTTTRTSVTTTSATTVTTTTSAAKKDKPIDWLLILGLALLGLLLAICCACCCLYCFLWAPAARRRRQRRQKQADEDTDAFGNVTLKSDAFKKVSRPSTINRQSLQSQASSRDFLIDHCDDKMKKRDSGATSIIPLHICESPPPTPPSTTTTTPISKILKKTLHRGNSIEPVDDAKKVEPPISKSRLSGVNIDLLPRQSLPSESNPSPINESISKKNHVYVKKVMRNEASVGCRTRRSSIGNLSVISLDQSAVDVQLMANRTRPCANTNVPTSDSAHGSIIVTKILRSKSIILSHK